MNLPKVIEDGGLRWKVLRREGNFVLVEGTMSDGLGRKRYDVCQVYTDAEGLERIRTNYNYDGSKDSPTWDKEAMTAAFNESVNRSKALARQKLREAEQERQKIVIDAAWEKLTNELRDEQSLLVDELKALTRSKTSLPKRANEIGARLSVLEQIFHHGKPRAEL